MPSVHDDARVDEPVLSVCLADGVHHSSYVREGAATLCPEGERPSLAMLMLVVDSEGWTTCHRITAIYRAAGRIKGVRFGPRVPWPDGSVAARHMGEYSPEGEIVRQAEVATFEAADSV